MWNRIIHPRMLATDFSDLSDFYHFACNIEEATVTYSPFGSEVLAWANKVGHTNIPCVVATAGGREVKAPDMTYVVASHTISLAGNYPLIQEKMRAVIGSFTFDILAVSHDSQNDTTHLECQILT